MEMPTGAATRLHVGIAVALIIAFACQPTRGATRALLAASGIVALLAPLWLVGGLLVSGALGDGTTRLYVSCFLSYAIPGLLSTGVGMWLRQKWPALRSAYLASLVGVAYLIGFLLSIPWSVSGALVP